MSVVPKRLKVPVSAIAISGLGPLLFVGYLLYVSVHPSYLQGPTWLFPLGLSMVTVLSLGLFYGGWWVYKSEFSGEGGWRVVIWTFAGLIAALALTFWPIFYQRLVDVTIEDPIFILLVSSGLGANAGVVAGINQIRSEEQYEQVQEARDSLMFLNRLLRHNILNAITVILVNAEHLIEHADAEETVDRCRTIQTQGNQISDLVQNAKVLIQRVEGTDERERVDFASIAENVVVTVRETWEDAVIECDLPTSVLVQADPLLSAVVENIVTNAIVHNDSEQPRVEVSLATRADRAVLRVADNGPGLDETPTAELIDPGEHGDEGLGLYLVDTFVSKYGGDLRIEENDPRGTVVTVSLPLWDDPAA